MTKKIVFNNKRYNISRQDSQRNVENLGYYNENYNNSAETNALDKWRKYSAERNDQNIFPSSSNNVSRMQIHDAINRVYDNLNFGTVYFSTEEIPTYHNGYNFNKQKLYNYVEEYLLKNPEQTLEFIQNPHQFIIALPEIDIKNILVYEGDVDRNNTTLPVLKTNIGEIVGHHKDGTYEKGLQGPYTEAIVGGYKHRHQQIAKTADRPERFLISQSATNIVFSSPISSSTGLNYNIPYSRFSRNNFIKSVVNIENVKISNSNLIGNFYRNYEIVNGLDRGNQNLTFIDKPDNFSFNTIDSPYVSGVVEYSLPDRKLLDGNYNKTAFVIKFSAPGDVNSTNPDYTDRYSEEISPYNTVNYRNSSPRFFLNKYLSTPSYFGGYTSGSFGVSASYQKSQRNNRRIAISGSSDFKLREDNGFINYQIPACNGGYTWIKNYTAGGNNPGLFINGADNNIIFITSSSDSIYFSQISSSFYTFSDDLATISEDALRLYNIKINGLWNFSSKQQVSNLENKIIRYRRKNNIFSDQINKDYSNFFENVSIKQSFISDKYTNTRNIYEQENKENEILSYEFAQTYCPVSVDYYNSEENKIKNLYNGEKNIKESNKNNSSFKRLLEYDKFIKIKKIEAKKIKEIDYEEKIYPRGQNVYRNFARIRNAYSQSWADSLDNRLTELTNSQGNLYLNTNFLNKTSLNIYNYSYWPLDADTKYDSLLYIIRDKSGELLQLDNVGLYYPTYGFNPLLIVPSGSYFGARFGRNWNTNRPANVVHEQAGRGPYYDSYTAFYSDIKNIGQGYSVIPEYRISPKLDSYYKDNISYYDNSFNQLELTGTTIEDFSIAINTSSAFIEQRVNSDYIDLSGYLNDELKEFKLDKIKVKVGAIKKLLPYDEFYPQTRMLKLAQQFSSSYSSIFNLAGTEATFRTALAPMYAPGIGFNSVKAGVGMPYAVASRTTSSLHQIITGSLSIYYYQKLPWETILYPYKNFQNVTNIYDADPDIIINSTASISRTGSYNQIYDYKANNFYAEVINMFKENGELTSIKSKDNSEWYFPDLTKKYALDIVINKRGNYYTYSSLENFGPRPYAFHNPPWNQIAAAYATSSTYNNDRNAAPNEATASGESYVRVIFDPSSLFVGTQDYAIQGKYNIGDIIRNSSIEYYSSMFGGTTTTGTIQLSDVVDIFSVSADGKSWQPRLYWECPTADLNFYNLSAKKAGSTSNDSGAGTIGNAIRGIWHQYSSISDNTEGLFLSVRDSNRDTTLTGSLLDVVGFDNSISKKIGKIADSVELSEALILIPFYQDDCGEDKYFDLEIDEFEKLYTENRGLIGEIKAISKKYNLPPMLDYIKFRDEAGRKINKDSYKQVKSPFLMFAFEFSTTLSRQDLADIWQGVMPSISTIAEMDYKEKEIMIGHYLKDFNFKLPPNTRFKIFKVKKKATTNYQQIIDRTKGNNYNDISYGYNWPYDYCSLVEMAEVKVELNYRYDIQKDEKLIESDILNRETISRRSI